MAVKGCKQSGMLNEKRGHKTSDCGLQSCLTTYSLAKKGRNVNVWFEIVWTNTNL
jgi:hypothetical protein